MEGKIFIYLCSAAMVVNLRRNRNVALAKPVESMDEIWSTSGKNTCRAYVAIRGGWSKSLLPFSCLRFFRSHKG